MLEGIRRLAPPARFLAAALLRRARPAKHALWQIAHCRLPKLSRRAPRAFLAAVAIVTEQTGNRFAGAKKMNLKAVSLFFGARFRIDAPNVLFRIRISSCFHRFHSRSRRADCKPL